MKRLVLPLALALAGAAPAIAATSSSAYGSASVYISAFDLDTYDEVALIVTGRSSVSASAFVNAPNGTSSDIDSATVTFTNPTALALELYVEYSIFSESSTDLLDGVVLEDVRYDSNAYVTLGPRSAFTSTNGTYSCTEADYSAPGFDCFGVSANDYDERFDTPLQYLDPFASVTFDLEARAFAFIESAVPAVPLPAGLGLLLSGLALLGARRVLGSRNAAAPG